MRSLYKWGWWQTVLTLLLALPVFLTGIYSINYVFLASSVNFRCQVPECEASPTPAATWTRFALPNTTSCLRYQRRPTSEPSCSANIFTTQLETCTHFVYEHNNSIYAEFNLACTHWKQSLVGSFHNLGMMVSLPIIGYISDRWGRRAALVVSGVGTGVVGVGKSLAWNYHSYLAGEFLEAVLGASVYPAAFVLIIEWLNMDQRVLASLLLGVPLSLGAMSLALIHSLTTNWRTCAQIAYAPSLLIILYPWLLPESIRWLMAGGKKDEALQVLKTASKFNKLETVNENTDFARILKEFETTTVEKDEESDSLLRALISSGTLRCRLAVCCWWWGAAVLVLYGLAVGAPALAGSLHLNIALSALAEIPALLINTVMLDRVGRRAVLGGALLLTASSMISLSVLKTYSRSGGGAGVALFLAGKVGASMSMNALYVYTAELFPTRARHRLLAACSTCGRVGAVLAPLTPMLTAYRWWIPTTIFGTLPLVSVLLIPFIPDTLHQQLPNTFADLEAMSKRGREMQHSSDCKGKGIENKAVDHEDMDSVV